MPKKTQKYVLTGGPYSGKSTVIDLLSLGGFRVLTEVAREVIEEEQATGGDIVPWKNLAKFQEVVATRQIEAEDAAQEEHVFLDRGIIDNHAYAKYGNVLTPEVVLNNARNRYHRVFLLDLLPGYAMDEIRKESNEMRERIHQLFFEVYQEFGYEPIRVPVMTPEERVEFILRHAQLDN